jgi:hypothetical protein
MARWTAHPAGESYVHSSPPSSTLSVADRPLTPAQASAQTQQQAPPAEAFFGNPSFLHATLSPSGTRLAVTTAAATRRVALVVYELGDTITPRVVAQFSDADVVRFEWVGDDQLL